MADDTEKAIIYAFDQSGAVAADLRERALSYLRDLQVRARAPTPVEPPTRVRVVRALFRRGIGRTLEGRPPRPAPHLPVPPRLVRPSRVARIPVPRLPN